MKSSNYTQTDKNLRFKIYFPSKGFSNDLNNFMKANKGRSILLEKSKLKFLNSVMPNTVAKDGKSYSIPQKWKVI